jgi:uncharacterized protein DUF547
MKSDEPGYDPRSRTLLKLVAFLLATPVTASAAFSQALLPKADPTPWDTVLRQYVDAKHRVDYTDLKKGGWRQLNDYLTSLGQPGTRPLLPNEKKALLTDAYNAFTIQWVLQNYPIASIWRSDAPFSKARHKLGGKMVSLDEIESELRAMGDPRIHAALVCAARSCPPLRREAFVADRLDEQLDSNVRKWLANPSLNQFEPAQGKAEISPIFKWYHQDFDAYPGGLEGFLKKYAPPQVVEELGNKKLQVSFRNYDWSLNDQSDRAQNYSRVQFTVDWIRNWLLSVVDP